MNGDEEKVMEKIQEWWEEPTEQEDTWEDVNKKNVKKKHEREAAARRGGGGGGRGRGRAPGGGRGAGGRERGRGPAPKKEGVEAKPDNGEKSELPSTPSPPEEHGIPAAVTNSPALKGAWGARATSSAPPPAVESPKKAPSIKVDEPTSIPAINPLDVGLPSRTAPMPAAMKVPEAKHVVKSTPLAGGNVWATKGSAHLIQAEKPKPPAPVAPPVPAPPAPMTIAPVVEPDPQPVPAPVVEPSLPTGLSASVTESGAWGKSSTKASPVPIEIHSTAPSVPMTIPAPVEVTVPLSPEPKSVPPPPSPAAPTNVLNMGHWETGDVGDSQQLDFGFGSFGADTEGAVEVPTVPASPAGPKETQKTTVPAVSPARPPPGLSLGGMPPMPESAVMVHELENKMENASLNVQKKDESKPITSSLPTQQAPAQAMQPVLPGGGLAQQSYNQYGMPGMYNYNAAGSGFVGMTPAGPVLAGGVVPQPGKPQGAQPNTAASLPQQGLYGSQAPVPSVESANDSSIPGANPAAGLPPGMPGAMPYGNPALAHYGQPQFYMSQHQGGIGYNYAYGQFGGVAQGGFGYQQVMGQNQGYGAPHYDDHTQQTTHQTGATGGYHKNSGGYRGRNTHHNNNQYQNQYNPQGYGGQPYGMGYHGDHFNQRGGYVPGGMGDPYGMQQGMHSGGFQDDDQQKHKKGGRGNTTLQQFQQGPPQLGQQGFGLQGQAESAPSNGGWSNQGGWSGGAPSWQGNNN